MDWTYFAGWLALVRCLEHQEHPNDFNLAVSGAASAVRAAGRADAC